MAVANRKTKKKKAKWVALALVLIVAGVFFAPRIAGLLGITPARAEEAPAVFALKKGDLVKTLTVSGVVESAHTSNVYSAQNYPVMAVHAQVGDRVQAGDVLAELDMSGVKRELEQAELNLQSARAAYDEELRAGSNSLTNAQVSLDASRISLEASRISLTRQQQNTGNAEADLLEAEQEQQEPFDSYAYDKVIEDAQVAFDRRQEDLREAEADLREAFDDFDGYAYQHTVNEAAVALTRRETELTEAQVELAKEQTEKAETFDDFTYRNASTDALKTLERKRADYETAKTNYYTTFNIYSYAAYDPVSSTEWDAAWQKLQSAETAMETAANAVTDAEDVLERTRAEWSNAKRDFAERQEDTKTDGITAAEKAVTNAQNTRDDAQRAHDKALTDLDRAKRDAESNATEALTAAKNQCEDAQRALGKALDDKERAFTDYTEANAEQLKNAQTSLNDSQRQLQSAQNSVQSAQTSLRSAENALDQTSSKPGPSDTNIVLQEMTVERLNEQLEDGRILAAASGVVTEANAKVGASPSGVLFVIEDVDDLYVSANVKEYSLLTLALGQPATVTTDAAGDRQYRGEVSYISPKAITEAGSTSVEFEIRTALADSDADIRIGMNAFLSVVTDTKTDVFIVPLASIVTEETGSFVYTLRKTEQGTERVPVPVTVGLKTNTEAEISGEGLTEGTELVERPNEQPAAAPMLMGPMMSFGGGR